MAVFENNQSGKPDVYLRFSVEDGEGPDDAPALFLNITDDHSGDELLDLLCVERDQLEDFFREVDKAKTTWLEKTGQGL